MQLPAAHTGTINITGIVLPMTWTSLDITGDVVYTCSGALQTTKTMTGIHILPIADLQIHKSLQ